MEFDTNNVRDQSLSQFYTNRQADLEINKGALKSRDLTTRHHTARVDIARLISVFE